MSITDQQQGLSSAAALAGRLADNIHRVMRGQEKAVRKLLAGFVAGGHVLIEDYPGTGKTTLAKALARSLDLGFKRIQFTPDLLPSDILGVSILDRRDNHFHFHEGPVFSDVVLADEINRASPRTQSALLEAMAEGQASVDGELRPLSELFFVMATQNPIETHGTYPLPEAQMDRFALKFRLGYVSPELEAAILADQAEVLPLSRLAPCADRADLLALKAAARRVRMSDELRHYCVDLVAATRCAPGVLLGASPRASLALMTVSRALALFDGLGFVTPDHVREIAIDVVAHRLMLDPQARFAGNDAREVVEEILRALPVPA
jgi:MoxR-like ATPase